MRNNAAPLPQAGARRLRILLAIESCGGGSGRHVLDLARGLVRHGHVVHLAWSTVRAEPAFAAEVAGLDDVTLHEVPMSRSPGWRDAPAVLALRRLLSDYGFDIVHGHSSKAGALARLAGLGTAARAIYTPHAFVTCDPTLGAAGRAVYGLAERALSRIGDLIICVSEEERAHALSLGIAGGDIAVVPNGLAPLPRPDRAAARRVLGLRDHEVCLGFVGRLSGQKAVERLLDAVAAAGAVDSTVRLAIIGDGPDRPALAARAAALGIRDRAAFLGQADGPALMAGFDVFVLPSRYEGFPYVLLEAAARGLPIITTDVGGASSVVRPGENGYIVGRGTPPEGVVVGEMAGAIATLVADRALREAMGRRSAVIARGLDVDAMVAATVAVYRRALAGPDQ